MREESSGEPSDARDSVEGRETGKEEGTGGRRDDGEKDRDEKAEGEKAEGEKGEGETEEEEVRRPISVRDLMPSPSTRPSRRPTERVERREREEPAEEPAEERGRPEAAEAAEETSSDEAEAEEEAEEPAGAASVPTPVRVAMDAPPPGDSRPPEELPSRRFEVNGEEWIVRISGRTVTGTRPDAGALLMRLSFFRPDEPERPLRGLLTVDRPLDALYEEDLLELFERSRSTDRGGTGSG